ncbi:MAG: hypothetical protein V4673_14580 [Pseudomonadota bacterium]
MAIFTDDLRTESPTKGVSQIPGSFGEALGAGVGETIDSWPVLQAVGLNELNAAQGGHRAPADADPMGAMTGFGNEPELGRPEVPMLARDVAAKRVAAAGLDKAIKLPDQDAIAEPALNIMIDRARERRERQTAIERGPDGILMSGTSLATSFLVGALDPINLASAFIPVMGELRYGKLLASAGEGALARAGVRASVGAAEGVVGQAVLEPLDWFAHTQDGRDFGMAEVLQNLAFGAALGGIIHPAGGFVGDRMRARKGEPLYPFGANDPLSGVTGTHLPSSLLDEAGVLPDSLPEHLQPAQEVIPAMQILADLPPPVHADAIRGAIAKLTSGEPVRAGEMLEAASTLDPRIAESFEAWHGSPHVFDRFSMDHLSTGEGVQAYGHGLYFAERKATAKYYREAFASPLNAPDHLAFDLLKDAKGDRQAAAMVADAMMADPLVYQPDVVTKAKALIESGAEIQKGELGALYRVRIKADPERLLDYDKPLSEQSDYVRKIMREHGVPEEINVPRLSNRIGAPAIDEMKPVTGADAYRRLGTKVGPKEINNTIGRESAASKALREAGVYGLQYLDQGSRGIFGKGTRNFVVFDDKHIEIIDRNGQPVPVPPKDVPAGNPKITLPDVPESEITTKEVKAKTRRGRAAADPNTWSLTEFLADEGGLTGHPELEAIYGGKRGPMLSGFGPLIRKQGRSLEEAYRLAKEGGYMFDASDITGAQASGNFNDLLRLLTEEQTGRKQYRQGHIAETKYDPEQEAHVIRSQLVTEYEATGGKASDLDPTLIERTVEILRREGETDVLNAYERAIMEVTERYDGPSDLIHTDPSAGAASPAGGSVAAERGPAGLSGEGQGRADGQVARSAGGNDSQARDAAFRSLSRAGDDFDAPAVLEASRAADAIPDPIPTKLDERVAKAEQADAEAKSLYDMMQDVFTPAEREQLNDVLQQLDREAADVAAAIKQGGSCIFRGPRNGS